MKKFLTLAVVILGSFVGTSYAGEKGIPPLVAVRQDGTQYRIRAWERNGTEDEWIGEVQKRADRMREALAVTQDGKLVVLVNPRKRK